MTVNVRNIILNLAPLIEEADLLPEHNESYSKDHLRVMAHKLVTEEITGEKAHRWLGWFQACLVMGGATTFEEMKAINKTTV